MDIQPSTASRSFSPTEQAKPHTNGCLRTFKSVKDHLRADLYRYGGETGGKAFLKHYFFSPGYKYTVWMRISGYLLAKNSTRYILYPIAKMQLLRIRYKYGIAIPEYTKIGPGFFINRFGGIYIGGDCIIGRNVNITPGVLLGYTNRGRKAGCPTIGNNVFLGNNAKVVGNVRVGDGAVIGVNALVVDDVPENTVIAAPVGVAVSTRGSAGYINRTSAQS